MTSTLHEGANAATRTDPTTTVRIAAPRAAVFDVLLDPRSYPDWLLGAQKIRKVDPDWPAVGSSFHHTVGVGPIKVSDHTDIVSVDRPDQLVLRAHIGPFGAARVTFTLAEPAGDTGAGGETVVEMREVPDAGPIRLVWWTVGRWALAVGIWGRNEVTLENLKRYVESRAAG